MYWVSSYVPPWEDQGREVVERVPEMLRGVHLEAARREPGAAMGVSPANQIKQHHSMALFVSPLIGQRAGRRVHPPTTQKKTVGVTRRGIELLKLLRERFIKNCGMEARKPLVGWHLAGCHLGTRGLLRAIK